MSWWAIDIMFITTYHSGMDYYTQNMGGKYHDDFYTNKDIIDTYKAYIEHVLNRKNTLTGTAYKVSSSKTSIIKRFADMSTRTRMILLFLAGNWQMSLVVKAEAACKSHQSATLTPSPNGRMILARTSNPLTRTISWLLAMKVSLMMPPRASKQNYQTSLFTFIVFINSFIAGRTMVAVGLTLMLSLLSRTLILALFIFIPTAGMKLLIHGLPNGSR